MSANLYKLTQKINTLTQQKAKKYSLELEIENFIVFDQFGNERAKRQDNLYIEYPKIQEPQIRQILVAFQDVFKKTKKFYKKMFTGKRAEQGETYYYFAAGFAGEKGYVVSAKDDRREHDNFCFNSDNYFVDLDLAKLAEILNLDNPAEALCQKWLDGLYPLFDREPETVLQELVEVLEKI